MPKKNRVKIAFRIFTVTAVLLFVAVEILVRRFAGTVTLKPAADLAKLKVSADSYPCLFVSRSKSSEPLKAALQQCSPALNNDVDVEQYEVDLRSGLFILRKTDIFIPDSMPLSLTRAYRLWDDHERAFGIGGNHDYDIFPVGDHFPYTYTELVLGDGSQIHYDRISKGSSFSDFLGEHNGTPPSHFQKSRESWNVDHWDLRFKDGTLYRFPEAYGTKRGAEGALVDMKNPQNDEIAFVRDARRNLKSITSPHHHKIQFTYDDHDRVTVATDDQGTTMKYSYDQNGRLTDVQENGIPRWRYGYDPTGMTSVQDAGGRTVLANQYSRGRLSSLTFGKGQTFHFDYLITRKGYVDETMVTDPSGKVTMFRF